MTVRVFLLVLALSGPALAYIDPITGNILVQAVLVVAAGVAVGYHRVKSYLGSLFGRKKPQDNDQGDSETKEREQPEPSATTPGPPDQADR